MTNAPNTCRQYFIPESVQLAGQLSLHMSAYCIAAVYNVTSSSMISLANSLNTWSVTCYIVILMYNIVLAMSIVFVFDIAVLLKLRVSTLNAKQTKVSFLFT